MRFNIRYHLGGQLMGCQGVRIEDEVWYLRAEAQSVRQAENNTCLVLSRACRGGYLIDVFHLMT